MIGDVGNMRINASYYLGIQKLEAHIWREILARVVWSVKRI